MQINRIQPAVTNAAFGCKEGNCCCKGACIQQPVQDTVELSKFQKAKNTCKKGVGFVKTNKKAIGTTLQSAGIGVLTACTILGANQLMSQITKADTSALAAKLATFGGLVAGATNMVKHKDSFKK
ncbi:hypothetical protein IKE67_02680 [bacterium]|nr:hypothetical protein [bacterium]